MSEIATLKTCQSNDMSLSNCLLADVLFSYGTCTCKSASDSSSGATIWNPYFVKLRTHKTC